MVNTQSLVGHEFSERKQVYTMTARNGWEDRQYRVVEDNGETVEVMSIESKITHTELRDRVLNKIIANKNINL